MKSKSIGNAAATAKRGSVLLTSLLLLAATQPAAAAAVSTFDAGADGWTTLRFADTGVPNFNAPVGSDPVFFSAAGGNPGGRVSIVDPTGDWQYFAAPAAFLGNQSAALGQNLFFDLTRLDGNAIGPLPTQGPLVAATDGIMVLVYAGAFSLPQTSGWTRYNVGLSAGNWRLNSLSGAVATSEQLNSVFSGLSGLYLNADFFAGAVSQGLPENIGLDNVNLPGAATVPEPASFALVALGLLGVVLRRR